LELGYSLCRAGKYRIFPQWIVCWFPVATVPNRLRIGFHPGWEEPVFR
jgi:hypothetical protein